MVSSPSACARCPAAQGRSCCEVEGDERLASLTRGDIARIQNATGLAASRFVDGEILSPERALEYERLRPANRGAVRNGVRAHLLAREGACVLHRPGLGCSLDPEVRPLLCRLYPLEVDELGRLRAEPHGPCHAVDLGSETRALLADLATDETTVRRLHAQLLTELRGDSDSRDR